MAKLTETAEFTADVLRLDTDTPVRGFDGTDLGPSNEQAQTLANRTQWLKQKVDNLSTTQVRSVNGKTGSVTLTAKDISAEPVGMADSLLTGHLNDSDPHAQYFDETRGDARYVQISSANIGGGWLQLDSSGKIPAALLQTLTSRYVVVADQAARLALTSSSNLTICAQADIDTLFYLNGGENPAVSANWVKGQAATVSGVSSVYGRTGAVTAQAGDYDTDQVNETANREFATPAEKASWNAKQKLLVSGQNIRSLFGQSLLGSGDLSLIPAQMGSAAENHIHSTADIKDFASQTQQLITSSLQAGTGVTLGQNPVSGKTIISASGGGGSSGYIVVERQGVTAGQNHSFNFSQQSAFNLHAYALKEVTGSTNQTYLVDDFEAVSETSYSCTDALIFDGTLAPYSGGTVTLERDGDNYSTPVRADGEQLQIAAVVNNTIPEMTSENTPAGYVVAASSVYSGSNFRSWFPFTKSKTAQQAWASSGRPTSEKPEWLQITLPSAIRIGGYQIRNRQVYDMANLKTWKFQGSNDGVKWDNLHSVTGDSNNKAGAVRSYSLTASSSYSIYRLLVTDINSSFNFLTLDSLEIYPFAGLLINGGGKWYSAKNGTLQETDAADFDNGFTDSGTITATSLTGILPVKVYGSSPVDVSAVYTPYPQIAIQKSLSAATSWSQINSATLTATQDNDGFVRVAVSRDLTNWSVWRSGGWVDIGSLSADVSGATKLISEGMTPSDINGLNNAQWAQLYHDNNDVPDYLAFASALDISDPATDVATIDRLTLNVNEASSWMLQTPAQVEIRWRTDSVTFRTVTAGNYKLAYQIP
ncbi:discoidin domain-containing protein [Vagococcus sp. WN89Y]|uniref:discoidin domain-containing protein n=1 Tax=Vagococcus sp. WN89Y TaxID=3457258 RepID=UPI003FCEC6A1